MAINVDFWQSFAKKRNSTKQPDPAVKVRIECLLKADTSKESPVFVLKDDPNQDPSRFNYCSAFGYYYYIESREYVPPHWHMVCSMDYMASYKLQIGNTRAFITRANNVAKWDKKLVENLPAQAGPIAATTECTGIFNAVNTGTVVVSIAGASNSSTGCTHWAMDLSTYKNDFAIQFMDVFSWDITAAGSDYEKSVINPVDYIKDVRWYPFISMDPLVNPWPLATIYVGRMNTHAKGLIIPDNYVFSNEKLVPVQKHPQATELGSFLNTSQYTTHTWCDPWFGTIAIDPNILVDYSSLLYHVDVDMKSGFGHMRLTAVGGGTGDDFIIADRSTEIGVPMLFSEFSHGIQNIFGQAIDSGVALGTGNIGGLVTGLMNMYNTLKYPKIQTSGSVGSRAMYQYNPILYSEFIPVKPLDPITQGYPVCETGYIGSYYGFLSVAKGDVSIAGTSEARAVIKSYLEGGFYYE